MGSSEGKSDPGLGNMMLGYFLLGLQPLPVALLSQAGVGAAETVFARFALGLGFIGAICVLRKRGLTTHQPALLLLRGVLGGSAVLLYFFSIQNAGAARGTLLNYTYPVWANLFSIFLGRRPGTAFWIGLAVALMGLWLVIIPTSGFGERAFGVGEAAGLASAFISGAAVLTVKELRRTDETLTILASFSACGLFLSLFFFEGQSLMIFRNQYPLLLGVAVGVIAFLGHLFFTRGYRGMKVEHATILSLSVPVVASVIGVALLGESLSLRLILGGLLILFSTAAVLLEKGAPL
jgi:drug/metabolite transporter (DMT)-like permease